MISIDDAIDRRFPADVDARLERTLLNLAALSGKAGQWMLNFWATDRSVYFAADKDEMSFVHDALDELRLIKTRSKDNRGPEFQMTAAGWRLVGDLKRRGPNRNEFQGFIAMWFGNDDPKSLGPGARQSAEFCDALHRDGLTPAILDAGYDPLRIDDKLYTGSIVPEIVAEIRRSRFVVADFTGLRGGVYFEAGFAMALGIPVFLTCHKEDAKNLHFDISHYNILIWDELPELRKQLAPRIAAEIGWGPNRPRESEAKPR
ncbi:MAG: hypothetical protein U1A27_10750 [Phycisphaerae bacterium]